MKKRGHINGEKYCGNFATRKVHDLHNEKVNCQIDACVKAGEDIPFAHLDIARLSGYENCKYCM